jgi:hypothetical protein
MNASGSYVPAGIQFKSVGPRPAEHHTREARL